MRSRRLSPRERVLELLEAQGFRVVDDYIYVTQGWYRTRSADCIRWHCRIKPPLPAHQMEMGMFSWDTLTLCARRGIEIAPPTTSAYSSYGEMDYEVSAKSVKGKM